MKSILDFVRLGAGPVRKAAGRVEVDIVAKRDFWIRVLFREARMGRRILYMRIVNQAGRLDRAVKAVACAASCARAKILGFFSRLRNTLVDVADVAQFF